MRKFICLFYFSVFCIFFGNAQEQESEIFTLEEFLAMVKRYHPIVAQANLELSGAEAKLLKLYDPRVSVRIRKGETLEPGEYEALLQTRAEMIARADAITAGYDAVLMPTVATEAPRIADLDGDEGLYGSQNLLALRNTTVGNFLDRCAISLPIDVEGLPVGLMLMGEAMGDQALFAVARAVEAVLKR